MKKLLVLGLALFSFSFANIRAVDVVRSAPIAIVDKAPSPIGGRGIVGTFGELLTAEPHDFILVQFQYGLNTQFDVTTNVTGDGSTIATQSVAIAKSTTGTSFIRSRDNLRYHPGHTAGIKFTASFNGSGTGLAGGFDDQDGVFVSANSTKAQFAYRNGGVDTVQDVSWDDIPSSDIDLTKINIWYIQFGYLGVADLLLYVMEPGTQQFKLIDVIETAGTTTVTHVGNPIFPICIETIGDMEVRSGSWQGFTFSNGSRAGDRAFAHPNITLTSGAGPDIGEDTLSGTTVETIKVYRNKDMFSGKNNKVRAKLVGIEFFVDIPAGNVVGTVGFQIVGMPTLSGAPNYHDVSTGNSIMEVDHVAGTGASVIATLGSPILTRHISYVGSARGGVANIPVIDAETIGAVAYPGESFAILAKDYGGNGVTVRTVENWIEEF